MGDFTFLYHVSGPRKSTSTWWWLFLSTVIYMYISLQGGLLIYYLFYSWIGLIELLFRYDVFILSVIFLKIWNNSVLNPVTIEKIKKAKISLSYNCVGQEISPPRPNKRRCRRPWCVFFPVSPMTMKRCSITGDFIFRQVCFRLITQVVIILLLLFY